MELIINDDSHRQVSEVSKNYTDIVTFKVDESIDNTNSILLNKRIHFKDCQFQEGVLLNSELDSLHYKKIEFVFEECNFTKEVNFQNLSCGKIGITLINCVVSDLKITKCKINSIVCSRTIFLSRLIIQDSSIKTISIQNSLGNFFINDNGESICTVRFSDDNLYVNVNHIFDLYKQIVSQKTLRNIILLPTSFHFNNLKKITFGFGEFTGESGFKLVDKPQLNAPSIKEIKYYPTKTDLEELDIRISIDQSKGVTEEIQVKSGILRSIYIKGESESSVVIEHVCCDNFYLHDFQSREVNLYDVKNRSHKDSKFEIKNSNFSKGTFSKVNFKSFSAVSFYRSFIEKVLFSSSTFPQEILTVKNIHYPEEKEEDYAGMQYELYRQIKFSLSSNNNQLQALEMHQRMYNAIRKKSDLRYQDKFILCLNRVSNNHNTSISRAFLLSISLVFTLWISYCFFLPNAPFKIGWVDCESFKTAVYNFFAFTFDRSKILTVIANPVHNINHLIGLSEGGEQGLSSMNHVISLISRILVAWGYYQFVSAFRKFGKSI